MTQITLIPSAPFEKRLEDIPLESIPSEYTGPKPKAEFIESIRNAGLMQPITVRQVRGKYEIVDGRRRVAAMRVLHGEGDERFGYVPAVIVENASPSEAAALTIALHATRKDNAAAELEAIEKLVAKGATEQDITLATGLPAQTIRARLRLTTLHAQIREAWATGTVATSVAEEAARLPGMAQARLATRLLENSKLTAKDVKEERQAGASKATDALPDALFSTPEQPAEPKAEVHPAEYALGLIRKALAELDAAPHTQGIFIDTVREIVKEF